MRRILPVPSLVVSLMLTLFSVVTSAQQIPEEALLPQPPANEGDASLKICLRLQDDSPFNGSASLHVLPSQGYEVTGAATESEGEMMFSNLSSGTYMVEASAPGFLMVRQNVRIEPGHHMQTLFIIMKPRPLPAALPEFSPAAPAPEAAQQRASAGRAGVGHEDHHRTR